MDRTVKPTNVTVTAEVNAELIQLKADLHAAGMKNASNPDVVAGLILAARRSAIRRGYNNYRRSARDLP